MTAAAIRVLSMSLFSFTPAVFASLGAITGCAFMYGASHLKWKSLGDEDMEEEEDEHVSTAGRSLKLSAPEVGNFSGDPVDWPKWKASTIVTFVATGYEKVLTSRKYALKNKSKNKIVYAILSNATIDGHSHHRIKNHEGTQDGNTAWKDLLEWYDGEDVISETAETLRQKLQNTCMVSGVTPSTYINRFLSAFNELEKIPEHKMNSQEAKSLFLRNIHDTEYATLKEALEMNVVTSTLESLVLKLRKKEHTLQRAVDNKRRVRRQAIEYDLIPTIERTTKRPRRSKCEKDETRKASLPSVIHPNLDGLIYIKPASSWETLKDEHRTFVLNYNRAVRHEEDLPEIPSGVKIGEREKQEGAMDYFGKNKDDTSSEAQPESDAEE